MSALLHAAERQFDAATCAIAVDEDLAGHNLACEASLAAAVLRPHASGEAELGRVCERDGVRFVLERHRGQDRTEHFVTGEMVVTRHAAKEDGSDEEAIGRRVLRD